MLYIFHGTDIKTSATKARALVNSLRAKKTEAAFIEVDADHWNPAIVDEHAGGQGLFSAKSIVFLNRVTENAEAKENLPGFLDVMKDSDNVFIILEGKANADLKKSFEKHAEKIVVSDVAAADPFKKEFNIFTLADAVGGRDAFKSWTIYREALEKGNEPESIVGTLFWQIKSIMLASKAPSAVAAGLSPFVYMKSKKYASNYSAGELKALSEELITLYHDAHRGMNDMELSIERVLLGIGK